jgi:hypothetical protein
MTIVGKKTTMKQKEPEGNGRHTRGHGAVGYGAVGYEDKATAAPEGRRGRATCTCRRRCRCWTA